MNKPVTKIRTDNKEVSHVSGTKSKAIIRIDEEGLFNLFTADIMKMKIKFTR